MGIPGASKFVLGRPIVDWPDPTVLFCVPALEFWCYLPTLVRFLLRSGACSDSSSSPREFPDASSVESRVRSMILLAVGLAVRSLLVDEEGLTTAPLDPSVLGEASRCDLVRQFGDEEYCSQLLRCSARRLR